MTGATSGLGLAMTTALLEAGHRVAAVGRAADAMERLRALAKERGWEAQLYSAPADIRSPEACRAVVEGTVAHFGALDVLVNNAGANVAAKAGERFYDVSLEDWNDVIATNVNAPFYLSRLVAPLLVERGWGRIINHVTSFPTMSRGTYTPYGPSKAALEAATSAWAAELDGTGVTVNAILPGSAADTRRVASENGRDRSALVQPAAMAAPILWLISPAADQVTGQRLVAKQWSAGASDDENVTKALSPAFTSR
jgi:3-oxoacyl-[acyl-carrier protein] reductase